jgi:signal transduction histidine kinase
MGTAGAQERNDPHTVAVDADPLRLTQVFGNLLTNTARYTERPSPPSSCGCRPAVRNDNGRPKAAVPWCQRL